MANIWLTTGSITCAVASTGNLTLSGLQTVDGISLTDGQIVLAAAQSATSQSGPYVVRATAWDRIISLASGQLFYIATGSIGATALYELQTAQPIVIGTTSLTFGKLSSGAAGTGTFTTITTSGAITSGGTGKFPGIILTSSVPIHASNEIALGQSINTLGQTAGLGIVNGVGSTMAIQSSSTSGTAASIMDMLPFNLAIDATYDMLADAGGTMLVVTPSMSTCPMAHIGFSGNGTTSLNGVTPAGGISLTQDTASRLNVYQLAGNKVRFQNKTGVSLNVMAIVFKFQTA